MEAFERQFKGTTAADTVRQIQRVDGFVRVVTDNADAAFDAVILVCHSDQALALLEQPSLLEQLLGAMRYKPAVWCRTVTRRSCPHAGVCGPAGMRKCMSWTGRQR